MRGVGVAVNVIAVLIGSGIGLWFGHIVSERLRDIAYQALGLAIIVVGAAMALETQNVLVLIFSLVVGAVIGELIGIESRLEKLGEWLQRAVRKAPALGMGAGDDPSRRKRTLAEGFVTASLIYCVGPMTIVGSLQDGLGDPGLLLVKALLDGIASVALASTLGVGVAFSVVPILVIQGGLALFAGTIEPFLIDPVIAEFTAVGGALVLAIGFDIAGIKRLPYGNMLPAIVLAGVLGYFFG